MKVGIYLSGLGEVFTHESLERYAHRFAAQYDVDNADNTPVYEVHIDKFEYDRAHKLTCDRATILEKKDGASKVIYKLYEYPYTDILTKNFKSKNALVKTLLLFMGVCAKLPLMIQKLLYLHSRVGYRPRFRGQAFYLFFLFFVVSMGVLVLLPSAITLILDVVNNNKPLAELAKYFHWQPHAIDNALKILTNLTAILILLMPGFNTSIVSLACEFVSAGNYLERGENKQAIHGHIDVLTEQIVQVEGSDCEIYFHSYSFGSLVCIDYLFPYGTKPSLRIQQHVKGLITIGSPIDFVGVYYSKFFNGRDLSMGSRMKWINVYSLADALGSNFRKTHDRGDAEYSFDDNALKPININYEVANVDMNVVAQFFSLYALKAHGNYWDKEDDGQSCLRLVVPEMKTSGFL